MVTTKQMVMSLLFIIDSILNNYPINMTFTYYKYWLIKQFSTIDDIKNNIILLCKIRIIKAPTNLSTKFKHGLYIDDAVYTSSTTDFKDVECDCTRIWVHHGKINCINYHYGDYIIQVNFELSHMDPYKLKFYSSKCGEFKFYGSKSNFCTTLKDMITGIMTEYGYYETNGNVTFIYN